MLVEMKRVQKVRSNIEQSETMNVLWYCRSEFLLMMEMKRKWKGTNLIVDEITSHRCVKAII